MLLMLFPFKDRANLWPWCPYPGDRRSPLYRGAQKWLYERIWRDRFASYAVKAAISSFTREWTRHRWRIDCDVIYPPVQLPRLLDGPREPMILNVGRITPVKRQLDLIRTFCAMSGDGTSGWSFCCAGGLSSLPSDVDYLGELEKSKGTGPVSLVTSPSREALDRLFSRASIYWHAMGYGQESPALMEHFGITTVEAMASGCVPIVINRGGQPEIVRHGVDGFLWETIDELQDYTRLLIRDVELRRTMSESAKERARQFGKRCFVDRVQSALGLALPTVVPSS
jgi:glycosyltransferase involved in cell wall biosynthesis